MTNADALTAGAADAAGRPARRAEMTPDRLVHRASGHALRRLHARPGIQAIHYSFYDWGGLGPLTGFVGQGNYREAFGDPLQGGDDAQRDPRRAVTLLAAAAGARGRADVQPAASRTQRAAAGLLGPYVLSEAITAIVFLQILQPGGLVDATLKSAGLGRLVQLPARQPVARLLHALRRDHVEVHRVRDHPVPRRTPGNPARAARGGGDRRRDELDDAALHHAAAARADDPHLGVPGDHRVDPALRPRLDHDPRRPAARPRRWRRTWSTRA